MHLRSGRSERSPERGKSPPSAGESEFKSAWTPFDVRRLFALFRLLKSRNHHERWLHGAPAKARAKTRREEFCLRKGRLQVFRWRVYVQDVLSLKSSRDTEAPALSLSLRRGGRGSFLQQLRPGATTNISFLELHCKHRHRTNLHPAPQTCGRNPCSVAADRRDSEWFRPAVKRCELSALRWVCGVFCEDTLWRGKCLVTMQRWDAGPPVEGLLLMNS